MVQTSILLQSSFLGCIIPQHFLVVNNFSIYFNHRQHSCSSCCLALSLFSHGPNVSWLQTFFLVLDILLHSIQDLLFTSFLCLISTSCDFYLMINKCFNLKQLPNVLQTNKQTKKERYKEFITFPRLPAATIFALLAETSLSCTRTKISFGLGQFVKIMLTPVARCWCCWECSEGPRAAPGGASVLEVSSSPAIVWQSLQTSLTF